MKARFIAAWKMLSGKGDPGAVFDRLAMAYSEPHRFYHTLGHIQACLRDFDQVRLHADHADRVEMAIWFHDAVYDVRRHESTGPDNEQRSAEWAARELREGGVPDPVISYIRDLILVTRHDKMPAYRDAELMVDLDVAVFGKSQSEFEEYGRKIRQEYSHVPEEQFRTARIKIMQRFLERQTIYLIPWFREQYEAAARENLRRLIEELEKGGKDK